MKVITVFMSLSLFAVACSKKNPNLCCTDAADCAAQGISPDHVCTDGLVCRGNQCIAETCSTSADCDASVPFCSMAGLCSPTCETSAQCPGFGGTPSDDICSNGACVECVANADCAVMTPVCDTGTCRGCKADSECSSGACGASGECLDPSALLYMASNGLDAGTCTEAAPCLTFAYVLSKASSSRNTIVMAAGSYQDLLDIRATGTPASSITIIGGGATLMPVTGGEGPLVNVFDVPATIRDLTVQGGTSNGIAVQSITAPCRLEHVTIISRGGPAIGPGPGFVLHDVAIADSVAGIQARQTTSLTIDRLVIHGSGSALYYMDSVPALAAVDITNMLVYDASAPMDLTSVVGTIRFSTIGDMADGSTVSVKCGSSATIDASIVWNGAVSSGQPITGNCTVKASIVGPQAVGTNLNVNPLFVDHVAGNYHLASTSPTVDMESSGPVTDFEGDSRPQGAGYDLGADELKP